MPTTSMTFVRHDANGAITPEWMLGHTDPANAQTVVITRTKVYPCVAAHT